MKGRNRNYGYFADWGGGYERIIQYFIVSHFNCIINHGWLHVFQENYHCPFKIIINICEYFYTHTRQSCLRNTVTQQKKLFQSEGPHSLIPIFFISKIFNGSHFSPMKIVEYYRLAQTR